MDTAKVALEIEGGLRSAGDPARAEHEKRYLKSDLDHFGASVPAMRRIAKVALADHSPLRRDDLVRLVAALWARPVHECRMAAVELLDLGSRLLRADDMALIERLIRESKTWALVDGLAASVAGALVERHPELGATLDRWASDEDFWVRRSALLALLHPCVGERATSSVSRATRTPCSRSSSSSSARRSAGCFARRRGSSLTACPSG